MSFDVETVPPLPYELWHALKQIRNDYGKICDITGKAKSLRKWGESLTLGTAKATVETLPGSETEETLLSANTALVMSSSSTSDTTQTLDLYEGHTISGTDLVFAASSDTALTLNGRTDVALTGLDRARVSRARLSAPAVGNIYFHEGGATTNGVPNDATTVHAIIPAGEIQTQRTSTSISATDFWIMTEATFGVTEKSASWAQCRVETKPWNESGWYPVTQWIEASDSSGTVSLFNGLVPIIIPYNHDVRMSAIADGASTSVIGGMAGLFARVDRDA